MPRLATFTVSIDFDATPEDSVDNAGRELIWETGGGTIGYSICYEHPNTIVLRASGNGGSIVMYTSTAGQSGGGGGASAYCVSKAGQIIFARCMAAELGPDNIRVNSIAPAWTETEMAKKHLDRIGREALYESGETDD